jgi:hypothetical protein
LNLIWIIDHSSIIVIAIMRGLELTSNQIRRFSKSNNVSEKKMKNIWNIYTLDYFNALLFIFGIIMLPLYLISHFMSTNPESPCIVYIVRFTVFAHSIRFDGASMLYILSKFELTWDSSYCTIIFKFDFKLTIHLIL